MERTEPSKDPTWKRPGLALFVGLFCLFSLLSHGYILNTDAEVEFQTARAIALRGSAGLSADHPDASTAEKLACTWAEAPVVRGVDGKFYTWFGIGHIATMVPFYWLGDQIGRRFPDIEKAALESWQRELPGFGAAFGEQFFAHFVVSFHSPLFGALTALVLFVLLGHFGFATSIRLVAVLLATLTTQFGPGTRESMADITAGFFLLFAFERAVAWSRVGGNGRMLTSGALVGLALLSRLTHLVPVLALVIWLLVRAWPARDWRAVLMFVLGGLPFGLFLLWFNDARFGHPLKTGYHNLEGYWGFNPMFGIPLLAASPGKGMLWFSPLLFAVPFGLRRLARAHRGDVWLFVMVLLGPWVLNSFTAGWHSSQAWGCRYLTPGTVVLCALASAALLVRARERGRFPVWVTVLASIGGIVTMGGWLAPYLGYYDLALRAIEVKWPEVAVGDRIHYLAADARMSPVFVHWNYAWKSLTGAIPHGGSEVFESLFGVSVEGAARPQWSVNSGFRHFWAIGLSQRIGGMGLQVGLALVWIAGLSGAVTVLLRKAGLHSRR